VRASPPFCSVARPIRNLPVLGRNRVICERRLADIQVPLASAGRSVLVMDPDPAGAGPLWLQHAVRRYRSDEDTLPRVRLAGLR